MYLTILPIHSQKTKRQTDQLLACAGLGVDLSKPETVVTPLWRFRRRAFGFLSQIVKQSCQTKVSV